MSDGIVFVLHAAADEKRAMELAQALAPLPAFAARVAAPDSAAVEYGMGAVCIVLWTEAAEAESAGLARAVSRCASHAICRVAGAVPPVEFSNAAFSVIDSAEDTASGAARLRAAIDRVWRARAERNLRPGRRRAVLQAQATVDVTPAPSRARRLAARSAIGLAATLAVVGVAAPLIGLGTSTDETERSEPAADQPVRVVAAPQTAPELAEPIAPPALVESAETTTTATVRSASAEAPDQTEHAPALAPSSPDVSDAAAETPERTPEAELPAPEEDAAVKGDASFAVSLPALGKDGTKNEGRERGEASQSRRESI